MQLSAEKTDYLNIFLMFASVIIAFIFPFELFLLSYALLGPLHYLTEIGWLRQKNYFTKGKYDYLFLIFFGLLVTLGVLAGQPEAIQILKPLLGNEPGGSIIYFLKKYFPLFIFLAFGSAFALCFFSNTIYKAVIIILALVLGILMNDLKMYILLVAVLIPTLIHVWLFTGIFILSGALKNKLFSGYISFIFFLLCSSSFFIFRTGLFFELSEYVKSSFLQSQFGTVNSTMSYLIFPAKKITFDSERGLMIQRFIAFAYTYHYLNWFSKTNVIRWHEVSRNWILITLILWIASIALYAYDYKIGFLALAFLSIIHVFLEFPLNFKTISLLKLKKAE
jgi:hypothetical protein